MGGPLRSRALVAVAATAALTLGLPAASYADETVVVRGTAFPDASTQLAYVGCTDLFSRDQQVLQPYIGRGPGKAPAGARSLGYDLAGGTAVGSQHVVSSMVSTTTASLSVFADQGAEGLAVAGYQDPADAGTQLMWFGTASVTAPAGGWHTVEATSLTYTWTKYDMTTRTPVTAAQPADSTVETFAAAHGGDGAGLYAITFGCDGAPFSIDAMRIGSPGAVTTYDIEGLATSLTISGSATTIAAGEQVTVRGALRSSTGGRIRSATVILERRFSSGGSWENIRVVSAGDPDAVARLIPAQSAVYRWRFVDRPLAEGTVSPTFKVTLVPEESDDPTPTPEPTPTPSPTETPSEDPSTDPTPTPTLPSPSETSTPEPSPSQPEVESPSPSDSTEPTPSATPDPTANPDPTATN